MSGERDLETFASIHFTSRELGRALLRADESAMLTFIFNENCIAVVVAHDVRKGDFVIHVPFFPPLQKAEDFENKKFVETLISYCINNRSSSAMPYTLQSVKAWGMHATRADHFSALGDRVFLVGDAAHQFPPSGGFGVNTGFVDSHNLSWKLASVLLGKTPRSILKSYDAERRTISESAINVASDNYRRGLLPAQALGLDRGLLSSAMSLFKLSEDFGKTIFNSFVNLGRRRLIPYDHGYFQARKKKIIDVVEHEQSALPLLFPEVDIGFRYPNDSCPPPFERAVGIDNVLFWNTTVARHPPDEVRSLIQPGGILPHAFVRDATSGRNISTLGK